MNLLHETKQLLHLYNIKPKKRLSQSFVVDSSLLERMIDYANIGPNDVVLDIGAGFGFLTSMLAERAKKVIAVEIDPKIVKILTRRTQDLENVEVINGDILQIKLASFNKVVSNPPYAISSALVFKLLNRKLDKAVLTLQDEFAQRLTAIKGNPNYGRLTVAAYYRAEVELLEKVPRRAFYPPPKASSAVVRFTPRKAPFTVLDENFFFDLIRILFTQRNRKVRKALTIFMHHHPFFKERESKELVAELPYLEERVDNLAPEDFGILSNELLKRAHRL
ncbi:ribosomal RNA small subunit methyltransferase A [Candidatus Bathyarchaeota archaeon]|nr:ribosomal RNA small subunit methyltransferase A [Candidatus Bathyarchaeota archaeon]